MEKIFNKFVLFLFLILMHHTLFSAQIMNEKKTAAIFPFHFASIDPEERQVISGLNELLYDLFAGQFCHVNSP